MKRILVAVMLSLTACSSVSERQHNRLMQQVEERVKLPKGAKAINRYARYYAIEGGRVVATYITLVDPMSHFYDLPVGQQRWLTDHRNLPSISDGGCSVVNVIYDSEAQSAPEAFCNGEA